MSTEVRGYLDALPAAKRATIAALRSAVREADSSLVESINPWGYLTYRKDHRDIFTLVPHERHANLQIHIGALLLEQLPDLQGTGKRMRHLRFSYGQDVDVAKVGEAVRSSLSMAGEA